MKRQAAMMAKRSDQRWARSNASFLERDGHGPRAQLQA
jgi:hypothetical protein